MSSPADGKSHTHGLGTYLESVVKTLRARLSPKAGYYCTLLLWGKRMSQISTHYSAIIKLSSHKTALL